MHRPIRLVVAAITYLSLLSCGILTNSMFIKVSASLQKEDDEFSTNKESFVLQNGKLVASKSDIESGVFGPFSCPVCFDEKTQREFDQELPKLLPRLCQENHYMCFFCLKRCLKQNPTCPLCRRGMIFCCRRCKQIFGSLKKLQQHKEEAHTFGCSVCSYVTDHQCELASHLRTHEGKRYSKVRYCTCKVASTRRKIPS